LSVCGNDGSAAAAGGRRRRSRVVDVGGVLSAETIRS